MKIKIPVIVFLLLILYGCYSPKYIVATQSDLHRTDIEKSMINYIPLDDKYLENSLILDSTYSLLKSKNFYRLENYVEHLKQSNVTSPDFYLANVFSAISTQNYSEALSALNHITDSEYALLVQLLTIDLKYETDRTKNNINFPAYLKQYQKLVDSYPDNLLLKRIVAIRLRYLRYNY